MATDPAKLIDRDLAHIWHPCSQMKDYETFTPSIIESARGSYLYCQDGHRLIDANSSWWCKSLGHGHPKLKAALLEQAEHFEHVILANTSNEAIVELSERISQLTNTLDKVMYAGDGSCAVEMALKMSLHARLILGQTQRQQFMSLSGAYHGETFGALAVSDLGLYRKPFDNVLLKVPFIKNIPMVSGPEDPLWSDCSEVWPSILEQLAPFAETLTALIVEPIVQAAGGMQIYSQDFLKRLRQWTTENDVHLIADEIMTGFGRTGEMLACQHAGIEPDLLCLGKGITSGWLAMSTVVTSTKMYNLFYDDYSEGKSFLHSHTFSGNALAAAVANACFDVMARENILSTVQERSAYQRALMQEIADETGLLHQVRGVGYVIAADIQSPLHPRQGYEVYQHAVKLGALLRPLGNTLYWVLPLNTDVETMQALQKITRDALLASVRR